jgi:hypothetical protein
MQKTCRDAFFGLDRSMLVNKSLIHFATQSDENRVYTTCSYLCLSYLKGTVQQKDPVEIRLIR